MRASNEFDVLIVGSGFAGSLTAAILAQRGLHVALVDRARHPRFAIGESSTPTANFILRQLAWKHDLREVIPLCKFGPWRRAYPHLMCGLKRGFSYFSHVAGQEFESRLDHANELLVAASANDDVADTQWLRADVDEFCFRLAQSRGCVTFEEVAIRDVEQDQGGGFRVSSDDVLWRCRFLIDATGRAAELRLAERFPCRLTDSKSSELLTHSRTLYGHFANLPRWEEVLRAKSSTALTDFPFRCDDAALHHILNEGWMWWIRFENNITSVGLVLDEQRFPLDPSINPADEWQRVLGRYPSLLTALAAAEFVSPEHRLVRTGRLQRRSATCVGRNWAMLPHTAGFIDPLFSTGIACALAGVDRLTTSLLHIPDWSGEQFRAALEGYERATWAELAVIDHLVSGAYAAIAAGSFPKFVAQSMAYFAAATSWEHRCLQQPATAPLPLLFLADDPRFVQTVMDLGAAVPSTSDVEFEQLCRYRLSPFNHVGLFAPAQPNLYGQTAAPEPKDLIYTNSDADRGVPGLA